MREARQALAKADEAERAGDASDYWWHMSDVFGTACPYPQW